MRTGRKGFTLIELLVVLIIIGILASVAGPMMVNATMSSKKSEAVACLGSIRTALRNYYMEYGSYPATIVGGMIGTSSYYLGSYIKPSDLNGRYFNSFTYSVGPFGVVVANTKMSMDQKCRSQMSGYNIMLYNNGAYWNW